MKMYYCFKCGEADEQTYRQARRGNLIAICKQCEAERKSD